MKTLKFKSHLCDQILDGSKTSTWRLFDDKDLQNGDELEFLNKDTGETFGTATITSLYTKTLGTLEDKDWEGHERFASDEEMYSTYRQYYGDSVDKNTEVKLLSFAFTPTEAKIYNKVVVVDEEDNVIGAERMTDAIERKMIRRASRVYVFNQSGQLLVQQRSEKVLKPLMLDQSAAGHVDEGETYEEAAYRELEEELGLTGRELELIATSFRTTDFYNAIYRLTIPDDTEINFDPEEIKQVLWYDLATLTIKIANEQEKFTPAFKEAWALLGDKLKS
jgi:16S rRNA (adenine1518-N6/adenine1519-N6)-dimethyltransferase